MKRIPLILSLALLLLLPAIALYPIDVYKRQGVGPPQGGDPAVQIVGHGQLFAGGLSGAGSRCHFRRPARRTP